MFFLYNLHIFCKHIIIWSNVKIEVHQTVNCINKSTKNIVCVQNFQLQRFTIWFSGNKKNEDRALTPGSIVWTRNLINRYHCIIIHIIVCASKELTVLLILSAVIFLHVENLFCFLSPTTFSTCVHALIEYSFKIRR